MSPYRNNPIEKRKQDVRKHMKAGAIGAGVAVVGGAALAVMAESFSLLILGLILAVVIGGYNWMKIQKIVNHKDPDAY